jgi:hypothetical protein
MMDSAVDQLTQTRGRLGSSHTQSGALPARL